MFSGNPGRKRVSPGSSFKGWAFHVASSIAAEQAAEVKKATMGIWNLVKTGAEQEVTMMSTTAQTGRVGLLARMRSSSGARSWWDGGGGGDGNWAIRIRGC